MPRMVTAGQHLSLAPAILLGPAPLAAALLTVVLVVFAVLAWVRHYWSVPKRLLFALVTLAALVFAGLGIYWGLLILPF